MSTLSAAPARAAAAPARLPSWWPLALLTLLAAALRLSTLDLQSLWYDEAFTPVHVLHPSLLATLRGVVHTENSPPLWYLLAWLSERVLGDGAVALRLPSALAGIALVPVCWALGRELATRAAAAGLAAIAAFSPLFTWYSQEARAYALYALAAALLMLAFARAERDPAPRRLVQFAAAGALALLSHYFAAFLLAPMALWLARDRALLRRALPALGAIVLVGLALVPLVAAQGGHGTQWIGRWPLSERLAAIPQYYLTGASGEPLGHGIELLLALPLLAGCVLGLVALLEPGPAARAQVAELRSARRGALLCAVVAAGAVGLPIVLIAFGADYLAPRNLIGAMVPVSALVAVLCCAPGAGRAAAALLAVGVVGMAAITLDVDLSPRLQRGDWRGLAALLGPPRPLRAITTVELGSAPLQYYMPGLHNLPRGGSVIVSEIDETGYAPLRASAAAPPAPGFRLLAREDVAGLIVYRFRAARPAPVSEGALRRHVITLAHPEVLVSDGAATVP